jgi:imidazole glycerol-phosphate synthase subunit HisF
MRRVRVIPLLMIDNGRAVITRKFKERIYVGDPVNAIKILNDKEIDELIVLDITRNRSRPDFTLIAKLASESFMPLAYGGHLNSVQDAEEIIKLGVEKVSFNRALRRHPEVIREMAHRYGSQSIIVSIDIAKNWVGKKVVRIPGNLMWAGSDMKETLIKAVELGAGEILLNMVDRDGMMSGYDFPVIKQATSFVNIPVVACGGACQLEDFRKAVEHGASAVAAGAMFYFKGSQQSILINYPNQQMLTEKLYSRLI